MIDLKLNENLDLDFKNDLVTTHAIGHSINFALASKIGESTLIPTYGLGSYGRLQQNDINEIDGELSQVLDLFVQDGVISSYEINSEIERAEYIAQIELRQTREQALENPLSENEESQVPILHSLTPDEIVTTFRVLRLVNGRALRLVNSNALRLGGN